MTGHSTGERTAPNTEAGAEVRHGRKDDAGGLARAADLVRWALWLLAFTIAYNVVEGVVAVWFGSAARSISLVAFGLDSGIECGAAAVLLWRIAIELRGADEERTEAAERRAMRFVGGTFMALAIYVTAEAAMTLWNREPPEASVVGIVLTIVSLLVMPTLAWVKLRNARRIGSRALESEAKETIACAWLSSITLGGLAANAAFGWWWADPVAGLAMIPWLLREGMEGLRGEADCC